MATEATVTVDVIRHVDGRRIGSIELPRSEWETYADCTHPAYQWPEGLAEAGTVLSSRQCEALGLDRRTVIWLE
jgi:hypothetical protein